MRDLRQILGTNKIVRCTSVQHSTQRLLVLLCADIKSDERTITPRGIARELLVAGWALTDMWCTCSQSIAET